MADLAMNPGRGASDETVLVVSVDAFPRMGGISTMTHHLANVFADLTGRCILLGPAGSHLPQGFERRYELCEDWESDTATREGAAGEAEDQRIERFVAGIIARERPSRLLLMHGFYYGPGTIRAARQASVPVSVYVHGTELASQLTISGRAAAMRDPASLSARYLSVLRGADEVLTNSEFTAGLVTANTQSRRVRVTGVGLPLSRLAAERRASPRFVGEERRERRRLLGFGEGPLVTYIGRVVPHKRIDRMLRVVAAMPGATCVIGGEGPAAPSLRSLAAEIGIAGRCHFPGALAEEAKWALLRAADFSFLTSAFDRETGACEGFGIGLLEAAAAGAVPVSTGADGMADFVLDPVRGGVALPVGPLDPAVVAGRLMSLLGDDSRMDEVVQRGRRAISTRFNWSTIAREILSPDTRVEPLPVAELRHAG
ncbi:glycosyltransferase [Rhodobacteraceae bacterium NNCM2]|nr:glycosyltransferase [Coraliihabitans acroporae]